MAQQLIKAGVTRIYYGSELSVPLADQLAKQVCPQWANEESTSLCRSDKYAMQEALNVAGLPSVKQIKMPLVLSSDDEKKLQELEFPVVIKPINHGGAFGVTICHNREQVENALKELTVNNLYNYKTEHFLAQECLIGQEYFIDTFSEKGKHWISGIQRYQRDLTSGSPINRYAEMIDPEELSAKICIEYVLEVLSALGLQNGFAHTEVMLTANGPRLIEVNPRISGAHGTSNKLFQLCGFSSQVALLVASCQNQLVSPQSSVSKGQYGRKVYLQNREEQRKLQPLNKELLATLPSFVEATMLKTPGMCVSLPKTLMDTIAFVLLVNKDDKQLIADHQKITEWESAGELF